eukprot:g16630.t1
MIEFEVDKIAIFCLLTFEDTIRAWKLIWFFPHVVTGLLIVSNVLLGQKRLARWCLGVGGTMAGGEKEIETVGKKEQ